LKFLRRHRTTLLRMATGVIAAGAIMLGQPWGFLFWQEPFVVNMENPFWAGVYAASLSMYKQAFWVLIAGVIAFVGVAHFSDPERKA